MVDDSRHAAGQTTYEVHEVLEHDPAVDLGLRFTASDFSEAIELALDYLQAANASGREISALQIVRVAPGGRAIVWSYGHSGSPASREDLIRLWGFDPTRPWGVPSALEP
jgi:hypothetical protein